MNKKKLFPIIIIGLLILGVGYVVAFKNLSSPAASYEATNTAAMSTDSQQTGSELLDAEGKPVNFADFNGKVVFVNNWASWCPPCVAEMPTIEELKVSLKDKELAFVMVSFDEDPEKGLQWMEKKGFDLPVYFPGKNYPQEFMTDAIPATFILDKQGKVLHSQMGMADYSHAMFKQQMEKWINQ